TPGGVRDPPGLCRVPGAAGRRRPAVLAARSAGGLDGGGGLVPGADHRHPRPRLPGDPARGLGGTGGPGPGAGVLAPLSWRGTARDACLDTGGRCLVCSVDAETFGVNSKISGWTPGPRRTASARGRGRDGNPWWALTPARSPWWTSP